ncbi:MAG TPA: YciI family protein [Candidatus Binatia bacterium]
MTYDDVLRKNGHFVGGGALQSARNANTLRWKNGKLSMTDGPYAETKEQLGGGLRARSQGPKPRDSVNVEAAGRGPRLDQSRTSRVRPLGSV